MILLSTNINMNLEKRDYILSKIINSNKKLIHFSCNKNWYIKNNLLDVYNDIFSCTYFLDNYIPSLRERLYYIENNIHSIALCEFCNKVKLQYLENKVRFSYVCSDTICKKQYKSRVMFNRWGSIDKEERKRILKNSIVSAKKRGEFMRGKSLCDIHGDVAGLKIKEKMKMNRPKLQTDDVKRKRVESRRNNNPYWHSSITKEKIRITNIITHNSATFKETHRVTYLNSRAKISEKIKQRILDGTFTPCITNTWTRWKSFIQIDSENIKKFRSNWDAAFWLLNQHLEYEKIRIPYIFEEKYHIYIVDFVDRKNNILYEIKPDSLKIQEINIIKENAAKKWCSENNYMYVSVNDEWFKENIKKIDFDKHSNLKKSFKAFL